MKTSGLLAIVFLMSNVAQAVPTGRDIDVRVERPVPTTLYDWARQRCDDQHIPDAPARAYRRADNQIVLIASHYDNWMMVGPRFDALSPVCKSILPRSTEAGAARLWIEATYTRDGKHVSALLSRDLSHVMKAAGCVPGQDKNGCWLNDIVAAHSEDMGLTFRPRKEPVISMGGLPSGNLSRYGAFTTSNIVSVDNYQYVMAYLKGGEQRSGNCLFRTADPSDPAGWRGWDGQSFSVNAADPVQTRRCERLRGLPSEVRSISWSKQSQRWIAIFVGRFSTAAQVPGFYYSVGQELRTWSQPRLLVRAPIKPRELNNDEVWAYPSLIDPDSRSLNYDVIEGDHAMLLFTRTHLVKGNGSMRRDIAYLPVTIDLK